MEKEKEGFPITSLREINTILKAQHPNIVTVRVGWQEISMLPVDFNMKNCKNVLPIVFLMALIHFWIQGTLFRIWSVISGVSIAFSGISAQNFLLN